MTNLEAIIATVQVTGYSQAAIEKALLDANITSSGNYVSANKMAIDIAALGVLKGMLAVASISEGGYSISYSIEGIRLRISQLEGLYNIGERPVIKRRSFW